MKREMALSALGHRWTENGHSSFTGELNRLFMKLDRLFLRWASQCAAEEVTFPVMIQASELAKLDYFRSFPHLATFACTLEPDAENLKAFTADASLVGGAVPLTKTVPVRDVLTPAACYHIYIHNQGARLTAPKYVTTRCTCFRREEYYRPLERQWGFNMREIVCIGDSATVKAFLASYRDRVQRFFARVGWPISWDMATDPFFDPTRNAKFLMQKLDPVKTEMVFEGGLSIGSLNFHRNFFGDTFCIESGGEPAFSGCVAFGVERWIFAFLQVFGSHPAEWPEVDSWEALA